MDNGQHGPAAMDKQQWTNSHGQKRILFILSMVARPLLFVHGCWSMLSISFI